MNRKRVLLAVLLLLLLFSIGYSIYSSPRQERVAPQQRSPATRREALAARPAQARAEDDRLRVDLLKPASRRYSGVSRDLFYGEEPRIVKPVAPPPPPPPALVAPPPPPPPPPPPIISTQTRMELGRFVFLGYLEKLGIKTIFLGAGSDVFVVKKGDRFGSKSEFLVVELTPAKMTVRDRDNPMLIDLPLVEKESLTPPSEDVLRRTHPITLGSGLPPDDPSGDDQSAAAQEIPPEEDTSAPEEVPASPEAVPMQPEGQTDVSDEE
ncbi:MAG: hypothetical protein A2091_03375 [Desulfuromonadales bacterium GWD2_61_12]|nr:MAG: hypothetical protein A2091_03375 [Desulfuromonadales bacterium GWD2_61_12]